MSDNEESPSASAPRRSQRERKQAQPFNAPTSSLESAGKRKRDDEDASADEEGGDDADAEGDDDDRYDAPKQPKAASKPKKKSTLNATTDAEGVAPAPKKPRTTKSSATTKSGAPKTQKRGRKAQAATAEDAFDADTIQKESKINSDNHLFNAILNPSSALQSVVEDFLDSLTQTPNPAQAELINCILRCCGCNDTVDEHLAVDYDGVVDALDNFTEAIKQDDTLPYPLTSKHPLFKRFRKSLSEFMSRLIVSAHDLELLYSTELMLTLQTWVVAMSSSPIRSVRHTATVVALELESALCEVAARVEKEAEVVARQREGERKRKGKGEIKGKETNKELESKANAIRERRSTLAEYLKEVIDGVFVHRYRDLDQHIRSDCVRSLGRWFTLYPAHFLDGSYLRYVGWVLSDSHTTVRLSALNALSSAYSQSEYINAMHHFTERFSPRLVEMARRDTDVAVRVSAVGVLEAVDEHGLLDEERRDKVCSMVYDREARVRKAVSGFVEGVWVEKVDERLVGKKAKGSEIERKRAGVKALAELLVQWARALDKEQRGEEEEETTTQEGDAEGSSQGQGQAQIQGSRWTKKQEVARLLSAEQRGRTALAVEALYDEIEVVSDWEALLDILLLDHSAVDHGEAAPRGKGRGKKGSTKSSQEKEEQSVVDEAWRLEEVEESVVLEVLVAALRKAKAESVSATKKGEEDTVASDITRALIKGLPRLFVKHQTDENRIAQVLLIPQLMNLDMYLEMRMMAAYSSLWDDVSKQFTSHSAPTVLKHASATIRHLTAATSLANTNSTKILELEDELASALRDVVAGKDELDVTSLEGDEVLTLGAMCARVAALAGVRDVVTWMEEDEGGKQSAPWDIVCALADRGRLGYKEEEAMVSSAIEVLAYHTLWKSRRLSPSEEPTPDETKLKESLETQRNQLMEKLLEYAVGTQSNTAESVKRTSFTWLLNIHNLFHSASREANASSLALGSLALPMEDEIQHRCAGYIQAEIERYAEEIEEDEEDDDEESSGTESDEETPKKAKKKRSRARKVASGPQEVSRTDRDRLEDEYVFLGVISIVLRSIALRVMHVRHGAFILAHYGRLGPVFDQCAKSIVDVLREEGMYRDKGADVVEVVTRAMEESFNLVLNGTEKTADHCVALAKVLASAFLIRGAQLSVVRKLDASFVVEIHTTLLSWIGKRLGAYESGKNKRSLEKAILFFRALVPLVSAIESRDALKIKVHLDQVLAQAKLEISPTAKTWEAARAYEKRLNTAMAKEKGGASKPRKGRGKNAKSAEEITTDEEGRADDAEEIEPRPRPKARPRRATRSAKSANAEPENNGAEESELSEVPDEIEQTPTRSRASGRKAKTPAKTAPEVNGHTSNGMMTPTPSRKRPRPAEEEEDLESLSSEAPSLPSSPASQATQINDVVIKRKRARH